MAYKSYNWMWWLARNFSAMAALVTVGSLFYLSNFQPRGLAYGHTDHNRPLLIKSAEEKIDREIEKLREEQAKHPK